jgi:hypothetical protein
MNGIVDVITLLLGLSGFGLQPNPKAPTADAALEYAIPDADVVAHFDVASVVPGNYKKLAELADQPQIKASPELAKLVRQAVTEVDSTRGLVRSMTGIDLTSDLADATAFVQAAHHAEPLVVVAAHGKFSAATIDKIGTLVHKPVIRVKNGAAWVGIDDNNAVAITSDGVLLFGAKGLLGERTRNEWKAPPHGPGTNLGYAADVIAGKPVFAVVTTLSDAARADAVGGLGGPNFMTDLIKRNKLASFALYRDGIGWQWRSPGRRAAASQGRSREAGRRLHWRRFVQGEGRQRPQDSAPVGASHRQERQRRRAARRARTPWNHRVLRDEERRRREQRDERSAHGPAATAAAADLAEEAPVDVVRCGH